MLDQWTTYFSIWTFSNIGHLHFFLFVLTCTYLIHPSHHTRIYISVNSCLLQKWCGVVWIGFLKSVFLKWRWFSNLHLNIPSQHSHSATAKTLAVLRQSTSILIRDSGRSAPVQEQHPTLEWTASRCRKDSWIKSLTTTMTSDRFFTSANMIPKGRRHWPIYNTVKSWTQV